MIYPQRISRLVPAKAGKRVGAQVVSPMSVVDYVTMGESRSATPPKLESRRGYWLIKTEPHVWSWEDQVKQEITSWEGVRNYQASNNLKAMVVGDLAFFYHSGDERQIMGIVEVVKPYYPDPSDPSGRFGMVDVKAVSTLSCPVTLEEVKKDSRLQHLALVRQSRLSVMPIDEGAWKVLLQMGKSA
jgi:predicted RNA-binding protein with PUA-like domain